MSNYYIPPKLPVPVLSDSLDRFLIAMKPLTRQAQFSKLLLSTRYFSEREGPYLQNKLLRYADETDNWASQIWVDGRFLSNRNSLSFSNGITTLRVKLDWSTEREMLLAISLHLVQMVRMLKEIHEELLPQEMLGNVLQSMSQYKRMVGGYRLPREGLDSFVFSPNSKHIVVLYAGRIYKMPVYHTGEGAMPLGMEEVYQLLSQVVSSENEQEQGHAPIGLLTSLDRNIWCSARQELTRGSAVNARALSEIEGSLFGLCIDESTAGDEIEIVKRIRFGDIRDECRYFNRWNGLGLQIIFTKDGYITWMTDHAMLDGSMKYFLDIVPNTKPQLNPTIKLHSSLKIELLNWEISPRSLLHLEDARCKLNIWISDYDTFSADFNYFGMYLIKKYGVYYQGFIQLAIHIAYYKLSNELTGSYQPVSMRSYREGRLEHPITMCQEIKTFIESMTINNHTDKERWKLMLRAIKAYRILLSETKDGHVFVKHMQALRVLAERECMLIELFQNSSFQQFIEPKLAISSISLPQQFIGTFPLINGHFVAYHTMASSIYLSITSIPSRTSVTSNQLCGEIVTSLLILKSLMITQAPYVSEVSKL